MPSLMLVLFLGATLYAQTPPSLPNQEPDKPPVSAEPGPVAGSGQSQLDPLGVPPAPGKNAAAPAPRWRLLPPEQPTKPPSKWKLFPFGKSPATLVAPWRSLPNGANTEPAVVDRTLVPLNTVVNQQQGPCAIPLTNVLPPSVTTPTIRRIPIPKGHFPMAEVRPPAPSCDDRK